MQVILVDSMHLGSRCYFAYKGLMTEEGEPSGVIHGFLSNVISIGRRFKNCSMVFCWDQGDSWRKRMYPSIYKTNRPVRDHRESVVNQLTTVKKDFLDVLGFKSVQVESVEGDDCISLVARGLVGRGVEVLIYSGDRDFHQLVCDDVKIIRPTSDGVVLVDEKVIRKEYGVGPRDWVKVRALWGDASDGLKGVYGIGPKTAVGLIVLGLDPSREILTTEEKASLIRLRMERVGAYWRSVHLNYKLSLLPETVRQMTGLTPDQRSELEKQVEIAVRHPEREDSDGEVFSSNLARYELASVFENRKQFWDIP